MKKTLLLAYAALLLVYLLPLLTRGVPAPRAEAPSAAPTLLRLPRRADGEGQGEAQPAPERSLRVLVDGEPRDMALEDYLIGVVAAEMPASFPEEALKAQAVAARSYALYCAAGSKHGQADLCAEPGCCQAWLGPETLRERWGEDFDRRLERIRSAVEATAGQVLRYRGEPVFAAFHSSSAGATEDCGAVWNPRPYLVSVDSPETAADVPGYCSSLRCDPLDFRDAILSVCPEADFSGDEADWVGPLRLDGSGRVAAAELGGQEISGLRLRELFALRSTAFTLAYEDGSFVFTVTGSGHGVGMSQYGAMVMARDGADYREILAHYYPGTELVCPGEPGGGQ